MADDDVVTLMAVGDIMLGDHPICIGHGVGDLIETRGAEFIFENVSGILREADIIFGNLESVLSDVNIDVANIKSVQLRGSEKSVAGLKYAGFDIISIANNHILEHGVESMIKTQELLSENDIQVVGNSRAPVILNRNGISFGFLAYCLVQGKTAFRSIDSLQDIIVDIKEVKDKVDNVVVSLHWGNEYIRTPSPEQFSVAHSIIDAGADLILGHHPHVLQGIEKYNNGVVLYSLGNFVFDMWQRKMRESMIFSCVFTNKGISDFKIIPIYINEFYQPCVIQECEKHILISKITGDFLKRLNNDQYQNNLNRCKYQYKLDIIKHLAVSFYKYKPKYLYQLIKGTL